MTITLRPSTEAMLLERARQEGQDLDTLVDMLLADTLEAQKRENEETAADTLSAHGINREQAADLRARLMPFAEDWEQPEMDVYDAYDAAKSSR